MVAFTEPRPGDKIVANCAGIAGAGQVQIIADKAVVAGGDIVENGACSDCPAVLGVAELIENAVDVTLPLMICALHNQRHDACERR